MHCYNSAPPKCRDVFRAFLVENAEFDGLYEIPVIRTSNLLPEKLITFSKAMKSEDYDCWVCFYEHDEVINRFWNNPKNYLSKLKKFKGVISPDYSLYYDMPFAQQIESTYKGKALGFWLQDNGIEVIPNVRWGDYRSYELACMGVERGKTIAVGTHGCIKIVDDKNRFIDGFDYIVEKLEPRTVIVYGRAPGKIFNLAQMKGINIISFESEFGKTHRKVGE